MSSRLARILTKFAGLALLLSGAVALAGPGDVHEGQWEFTRQMTIPGMPFQPQPTTTRQCITKKDMVPRPSNEHGKCEISTVKVDGNTVQWHVKCDSQRGTVEGNGQVAYSKDAVQGSSSFTMKNPRTGQPMEVTQTLTGHRVGDCPAGN